MNNPRYKAKIARSFVRLMDILFVVILFFSIREYLNFGHFIDARTFNRIEFSLWHFILLLALSVLWNRIFSYMGMYHFRRKIEVFEHIKQITLSASLGVSIILFCADMLGMTGIGQIFTVSFWIATVMFFLLYRMALFGILYVFRSKRRNVRNVVIAGVNNRSIALLDELKRPELGINIVGFVDDEERKKILDDELKTLYLCPLTEFDRYISTYPVDEVLITLPMRSRYDEIARMIESCAKQGIKVRMMSNLFDLPSNTPLYIDSSTPDVAINYAVEPLTEFQHDLKRFFDIVVSALLIVALSPILLLVCIIMIIDDGLPIIFAQERIGYNKRRFKVLKFRTMVRNAEKLQAELEAKNEIDGAAFKITNDPRITKIGKFLRLSSIDELPQLFNVFLGTMSLVGPRPLPIRDFELFYNDSHRRRFSVKPGITGLWQVSGRSEIDFDEWMRLDLQYIDNWSPFLELKILLWTIPAVFTGRGAK